MVDPLKKPFQVTEFSGPDYRPTGQVPPALRTERLVESLVESVSKLDAKVDKFDRALTTVAQDVSTLKSAHEDRARKHSGSIARVSENDSSQDAAIATIVTDVANLKETQATQLTILRRLDAVAANPMVRRVAYAAGAAILAYLTARGFR